MHLRRSACSNEVLGSEGLAVLGLQLGAAVLEASFL